MSEHVLFVTWDGPRQPYLKSLFLPPFLRLTQRGIRFDVLQCCYGEQFPLTDGDLGVGEHRIRVHTHQISRRGFPFNVPVEQAKAARSFARVCKERGITTVLARGHLGIVPVLLAMPFLSGVRLIWDLDGFGHEERVEFGGWSKRSPFFQSLRLAEAVGMRQARHAIVRTEYARTVLMKRYPFFQPERIHVVVNARDEAVFQPFDDEHRAATRKSLGFAPSDFCVVYCGSIGTQYLPNEMASVVAQMRERLPNLKWLILTANVSLARQMVETQPALKECVSIQTVDPHQVPRFLAACDVGISLRVASESQKSVAPVKVGEYLLCGVPVLASETAGDLRALLSEKPFAFLTRSSADFDAAAEWAVSVKARREELRTLARVHGVATLSLETSAEGYRKVIEG